VMAKARIIDVDGARRGEIELPNVPPPIDR
jgi:hypothetical protein